MNPDEVPAEEVPSAEVPSPDAGIMDTANPANAETLPPDLFLPPDAPAQMPVATGITETPSKPVDIDRTEAPVPSPDDSATEPKEAVESDPTSSDSGSDTGSYLVVNGQRTELTESQAADLTEELRRTTSENSPDFRPSREIISVPFGATRPNLFTEAGGVSQGETRGNDGDTIEKLRRVIVHISNFVETTEEALKVFTDAAAAGVPDVSLLRGRHFQGVIRETPDELDAITETVGAHV